MKPYYECKKSLWKDEHTYHHFLPATANPPKSDGKYAQKSVQLVRGSSLRNDFLQNPYFNHTHTQIMFHKQRIFSTFDGRCFWLLLFGKHKSMVVGHFIVKKQFYSVCPVSNQCKDNL